MTDLINCSVAQVREFAYMYSIIDNEPLLKSALRNPDRGVLAFLLESGLDLNGRVNASLYMPVWFSIIENENPRVLADAIAAGADVTLTDFQNATGLHAAACASVEHCEILLAAGINISARNTGGYQAIHEAARKYNDVVLEFLLARGADVNCRSYGGMTPLLTFFIYALSFGCSQTLNILVRAGANVNAANDGGYSVLSAALLRGTERDLFTLIVHGVDVEQLDALRSWTVPTWEPHFARGICKLAYLYMAGADVREIGLSTNSISGREMVAALIELSAGGSALRTIPCARDASLDVAVEQFVFECNRVIRRHDTRIIEVCTALQDLRLPALQLCEIIRAVLWFWPRLKFHDIWNRVVVVRHFHERRGR